MTENKTEQMTKASEAAFPRPHSEDKFNQEEHHAHFGLTKRELYACENHAQGFRFVVRGQKTSEEMADLAVRHTDALVTSLARPTEEPKENA